MKSTATNRAKAAYPIDTSDEITTTPYNVSWPTETYNVTIADREMKSTGTNRAKAAYPIDTSDEITTTPYNVSWPTETYNVTIADRTATWTKSDEEKHSTSYLSAIFNSPRDPCDNFYEFTCADWHATSSDLQQYDNADDAVTGFFEEMARTVLDGVVTDSDLRSALASFGLNVSKAAYVTASDVLHAAGTLLYNLDNAPILSVELISNPWNATPKLIALGEPDIFVSRVDVQVEASKNQLSALACKFFDAWAYLGERNDTLCEAVADIAFALAKAEVMIEEVRSSFIEEVMAIERLESWTKHMLTVKEMSGFEKVEDCTAVIVAYKSMCERPDLKKAGMTAVLQDRVNVPLMNLPEFASAFNCPADSPMNPRNRCSFWN
ncbi:hypothetical protein MRX96_047834 [Rhipicephalus microplus]